MEVNSFQILPIDVTFYLYLIYLKCGTKCANKKWKPKYMRHRRFKRVRNIFPRRPMVNLYIVEILRGPWLRLIQAFFYFIFLHTY